MPAPIAIVGQGLAGTLLAWELEQAGADFEIYDASAAEAGPLGGQASAVAAGIINPITGQRFARSWRVDELLPLARATYQGMETALGLSLWRELRVRRLWRDAKEHERFIRKQERGASAGGAASLEPYLGAVDAEGFWINGAAHVDIPLLLAATRRRWEAAGRLTERIVTAGELRARYELVIECTGAALSTESALKEIPWSVAKGELLTITGGGWEPEVILNRGHWLLPLGAERAKVGATYAPHQADLVPTEVARRELESSARELVGRPFDVVAHEVGLRLTVPDKRPVAGRTWRDSRIGVLGGLGSKGALLAPWLARQWWNHLSEGVPFDPAIDLARFAPARPPRGPK
jgi:glycine oxidase